LNFYSAGCGRKFRGAAGR